MSVLWVVIGVWVAMAVVMALGWWWQKRTDNGGWVDVFWTYGTGVSAVVAAFALGEGPLARRLLVAGLAALWSLRLGTYIFVRVAGGGAAHEDKRYSTLKQEWGSAYHGRMFGFMQIQAPISAVLCLAAALAAARPGPFGVQDLLGAAILFGSILGEAVADRQMAAFRKDPANRGGVCDTGLWAWSRHPNYLFEFLGWAAYPVIAFDSARPLWLLALGAPVAMYAILRFGTGVPPLESSMLASRGDRFRDYQARVPMLLPFPPPRRKSAAT